MPPFHPSLAMVAELMATDVPLPSAEACRYIVAIFALPVSGATLWLVHAFSTGKLMFRTEHQRWMDANAAREKEVVDRFTKWVDDLKAEAVKDEAALKAANQTATNAVSAYEKMTDRVEQLTTLLKAKLGRAKRVEPR